MGGQISPWEGGKFWGNRQCEGKCGTSHAKTAELIDMLFKMVNGIDARNCVLNGPA